MPKLSITIPFIFMPNWSLFLQRALQSIEIQTFTDYEVVITKHHQGKMASNFNNAIRSCQGEIVKFLCLDDYLTHENSLQILVDNFEEKDHWLVTGCLHQEIGKEPENPHLPRYTEDIHTGNNCIGSPSVLCFRREGCLYFDESLSWLVDCDLYRRYHDTYGLPKIVNDLNVVIGLHAGQASNTIPLSEKSKEHEYMNRKYA